MTVIPHPPIVSRDQWLADRKRLLAHEKELTKHYDRITAERRRLPMVKIEKDYVFDGPNGKQNLKALFDGRRHVEIPVDRHEVAATHSVFLVSTSAEPESGKSTGLEVLFYMVPRPASGTEITAG